MYGKPKPASHNSTSNINKPIRIFATKKEHPSHLYQVSQASSIIPHLTNLFEEKAKQSPQDTLHPLFKVTKHHISTQTT